jgi:hypothetical protein
MNAASNFTIMQQIMSNNKLQPSNSSFILYQDDNGVTNVNVHFEGEDV